MQLSQLPCQDEQREERKGMGGRLVGFQPSSAQSSLGKDIVGRGRNGNCGLSQPQMTPVGCQTSSGVEADRFDYQLARFSP